MQFIKYFPSWLKPNHITTVRLLLLVPIIYCFFQKKYVFMLIIFIIAVTTDLFDGALARGRNQKTAIGVFLDPIADRLLFFVPLVLLAYYQINKTLFFFALLSELILLAFALFYAVILKYIKLRYYFGANFFGKAKAIVQIAIIIFLFLFLFYPLGIFTQISQWLIMLSIALLYLSFLNQIYYIIRHA